MSSRISKDEYYLNIALAVSKRSTCLKRHYGCVIVKDDVIVATGYNGSPRGEVNCCDTGECKRKFAARYTDYTLCESVHAEQNAIMMASREELKGATLYLACENYIFICGDTEEKCDNCVQECIYENGRWEEDEEPIPCPLCQRMIKNAGITNVINKKGEVWTR